MHQAGTLAVALIAGGRSTRMGRDKAWLQDAAGRELWRGRLDLLKELGAGEILISCREDQKELAGRGARLIHDQWVDAGPMGGIVSCLEAVGADRLLVLAVDLPGITLKVLTALLAASQGEPVTGSPPCRQCPEPGLEGQANDLPPDSSSPRGAVFLCRGLLEPLVGVYPKAMAETGRRRLEAGNLALRGWIQEAQAAGLMQVLVAPWEWEEMFVNVNDPETWARWTRSQDPEPQAD